MEDAQNPSHSFLSDSLPMEIEDDKLETVYVDAEKRRSRVGLNSAEIMEGFWIIR
jgi:hypothetical protein